MNVKKSLKELIKSSNITQDALYGHRLYGKYKSSGAADAEINEAFFVARKYRRLNAVKRNGTKEQQLTTLIDKVKVCPVDNDSFFYSIDVFSTMVCKNRILDNYTIDYTCFVDSCFDSFVSDNPVSAQISEKYGCIIEAFKRYVNKLRNDPLVSSSFSDNISEIESMFCRPAEHFHEAIQRILFVNQWLWQSGHSLNGLGHLDKILFRTYKSDIDNGYITKEDAKQQLRDFFNVLHDNFWYKSSALLGDTGQIIILGGLEQDGCYFCNDLTYLFIEISKGLRLPDPKVLLRVSDKMPDDLLMLAVECISTGIGAPILANDDAVIPALIHFGYESKDAYNYGTSACWEPLMIGNSCEQNNMYSINFCKPLCEYMESSEIMTCRNIEEVKNGYFRCLAKYIEEFIEQYEKLRFEEDPLLTLFSPAILSTGKDIVGGGVKYCNMGFTSHGLSSVVNSILNIDKFVFTENCYSLKELIDICRHDYKDHEDIRKLLSESSDFGKDTAKVLGVANEIIKFTSTELHRYRTYLGGNFKFGLSSPGYIGDAIETGSTLDGRKAGTPFDVHISGKNGLSPTELISFASQLDYSDSCINGNVVDFVLSPTFISDNIEKVVILIKGGIRQGFYELQINVVDSATLIEAQKHPELFPALIVRVWGFSAYFKDLPKEYQDNLIRRTIEAEKAAPARR